MARRYVSTDPEARQDAITRRRALAQHLMQAPTQNQDWNRMPVVPAVSGLESAARLGSILLGGLQEHRGAREQEALNTETRKRLAEQLRGMLQKPIQPGQPGSGVLMPGQPAPLSAQQEAAIASVGTLPMEQQRELLAQASTQQLFPKESAPYTLGPGEERRGANNEVLASVPPNPPAPRAPVQPAEPVMVIGPDGRPRFASREDSIGQTPYIQPRTETASEPLESVVGPDGKPVLVPRSQAANREPYRNPTGGLSPRDATTAKNKLAQIQLARQQVALAREKFDAIRGTASAGPWWTGQGLFPTEAGESFDTAVDSMRNVLTTITRVPGVGSMSDFETKLAQAQFPSRGKYESNTTQQLDSIDQMLNALEQGYTGLLMDSGADTGSLQPAEAPPSSQPQPELTATGPGGKKIVLRNGQWVPL